MKSYFVLLLILCSSLSFSSGPEKVENISEHFFICNSETSVEIFEDFERELECAASYDGGGGYEAFRSKVRSQILF